MNRIQNTASLGALREAARRALDAQNIKILVCAGTGCVAGGSMRIYEGLRTMMAERGFDCTIELVVEDENTPCIASGACGGDEHIHVGLKKSGCHGFCEMGPLVKIDPMGWLYIKCKETDCSDILDSIASGIPLDRLLYKQNGRTYAAQAEIPFYQKQTRLVLSHCGRNDAESILEYIGGGGYSVFAKALAERTGADIIEEISAAGLRGRGGGGFPAGRKWGQVARQAEKIRYVVCNGDEGDPGAFMDRSIMEGDPHRLLEGMLIAGYAVGAQEGFIYVRAEYPLAVERLKTAIMQAEEAGIIGDNILGTDFSFHLHINQGAGAFVCGEGSALTASIEGQRGMPRTKPPRTVEQGLFGKPTVLNNVETFANVPVILEMGAEGYRRIGTEGSPGTKAFALTGNVNNTGLIEVPMGTTLREVLFEIGGGIKNDKKFKAVQIGGPSGGCLTEKHLDLPLDFDSLKKAGAMIGSGGLVVMDEDTCMVEVARFFMSFTQNESCGKCVPCREGTRVMLYLLEKIVEGRGTEEDLTQLSELAETIAETALCGLGKTAAGPVVSTMENFRDEYLAHVVDKKCPAHACQKLKVIYIDEAKCRGCSKCARSCPVSAISGKVRTPYVIDQEKCIKCGACLATCNFGAILEA